MFMENVIIFGKVILMILGICTALAIPLTVIVCIIFAIKERKTTD